MANLKFRIVGILNFFLGIPQILASLFIPFFLLPKLTEVYSPFNVGSRLNFMPSYFVAILLLLFGLINLYIGIKNFSRIEKKDKYFLYGILWVLLTIPLSGILGMILISTLMVPIYSR